MSRLSGLLLVVGVVGYVLLGLSTACTVPLDPTRPPEGLEELSTTHLAALALTGLTWIGLAVAYGSRRLALASVPVVAALLLLASWCAMLRPVAVGGSPMEPVPPPMPMWLVAGCYWALVALPLIASSMTLAYRRVERLVVVLGAVSSAMLLSTGLITALSPCWPLSSMFTMLVAPASLVVLAPLHALLAYEHRPGRRGGVVGVDARILGITLLALLLASSLIAYAQASRALVVDDEVLEALLEGAWSGNVTVVLDPEAVFNVSYGELAEAMESLALRVYEASPWEPPRRVSELKGSGLAYCVLDAATRAPGITADLWVRAVGAEATVTVDLVEDAYPLMLPVAASGVERRVVVPIGVSVVRLVELGRPGPVSLGPPPLGVHVRRVEAYLVPEDSTPALDEALRLRAARIVSGPLDLVPVEDTWTGKVRVRMPRDLLEEASEAGQPLLVLKLRPYPWYELSRQVMVSAATEEGAFKACLDLPRGVEEGIPLCFRIPANIVSPMITVTCVGVRVDEAYLACRAGPVSLVGRAEDVYLPGGEAWELKVGEGEGRLVVLVEASGVLRDPWHYTRLGPCRLTPSGEPLIVEVPSTMLPGALVAVNYTVGRGGRLRVGVEPRLSTDLEVGLGEPGELRVHVDYTSLRPKPLDLYRVVLAVPLETSRGWRAVRLLVVKPYGKETLCVVEPRLEHVNHYSAASPDPSWLLAGVPVLYASLRDAGRARVYATASFWEAIEGEYFISALQGGALAEAGRLVLEGEVWRAKTTYTVVVKLWLKGPGGEELVASMALKP